jgi:hypothetical protein
MIYIYIYNDNYMNYMHTYSYNLCVRAGLYTVL